MQYFYHGDVLDLTGRNGRNRLRAGALFSVINEQKQSNANNNNVVALNFRPAVAQAA